MCAGLADYFGTDPLLFRVGFVVLAGFGGSGVALYVLAWAVVPAAALSEAAGSAGLKGRAGGMRALAAGAWREAAGIGLLVLAGLLLLRKVGFWPGDAIVWPLVLASSGLALVARQMWGTGAPAEPLPAKTRVASAAPLPGGLLGAMLIVGAAIVFLQATGTLAALREALAGIVPVDPGGSDLCFEWEGPIEGAVEHLRGNGVGVELGPVARSGARGAGTSVYFRDPDGSLLELISYLAVQSRASTPAPAPTRRFPARRSEAHERSPR